MDPVQLAVMGSLLATPRHPRVIAQYFFSAAAASLSMPVPKIPGTHMIKDIFAIGGTATPSTPTGFTSIDSAAVGTAPGHRTVRKAINGSEAVSLTATCTSATAMAAIVTVLTGPVSLVNSTSTAFTTATNSFDPPNRAPGAPPRPVLSRVTGIWVDATQTITNLPIGFPPTQLFTGAGNGLFCFTCWLAEVSEGKNPTAVTGSVSAVGRVMTSLVHPR